MSHFPIRSQWHDGGERIPISRTYQTITRSRRTKKFRKREFIDIILADKYLAHQLGVRRAWTFQHFSSIHKIARHVSLEKMSELDLLAFGSRNLLSAMSYLSSSLNLSVQMRVLRVIECQNGISLQCISKCFPRLEVLELIRTPIARDCWLEIDNFPRLQQLTMDWRTLRRTVLELPSSAANSLEILHIRGYSLNEVEQQTLALYLGQLTKLTSLSIYSPSDKLCRSIRSCSLRRLSIYVGPFRITASPLVAMFSSPELSHLSYLSISFEETWGDNFFMDFDYEDLIQTVCNNLSFLVSLHLTTFRPAITWIHHLSALKKL